MKTDNSKARVNFRKTSARWGRGSLIAAAVLMAAGTSPTAAIASGETITVMEPRADVPAVERIPLAARLPSLANRRVAIIKSWPDNSGFDELLPRLSSELREHGASVEIKDRITSYAEDDPVLWQELEDSFDAFIYVAAASSSTTAYAFRWSAELERRGVPGVVTAFSELETVANQTNARSGAQARSAFFDYPIQEMPAPSVDSAVARILSALTDPLQSAEQATGMIPAVVRPDILMTGSLNEIQEHFYANELTDGLPVMPPTPALVEAMLGGTSHHRDTVVASAFPPEGLTVTVHDVAVNGVMAGCAPQHMPVLLASVEVMMRGNFGPMLRSTNSFSFMQVVNGPIRNEIGMNAGTNAVGPGNRANACMGRALRLFITNLGDGHFGTNLQAVIGSNSNYSFMFAENEEASPWTTLAESQGFTRSDNVLTVFSGGWAHSGNYGLGTGIEDVPPDLASFQIPSGAAVIVSPARASMVQSAGMSKEALEAYFQAEACRPLSDLRKEGRFQRLDPSYDNMPEDTCIRRFPEGSIKVIVAGNDASPMMQGWSMYRPISVSIDRWR
jgi:hypothetical protein